MAAQKPRPHGCHTESARNLPLKELQPEDVIPQEFRPVLEPLQYWFVIGGNAVRCLCPYRPTRDVDFGVGKSASLNQLLEALLASGDTDIQDRTDDTVHLLWNKIPVSIFLLEDISEFTVGRRLNVDGILATKLHAILDRGTRRDFFDLYVTLQHEHRGLAEALRAIRAVYKQPINDSLLLRALTFFDDAEREAQLPGEGEEDWTTIKDFFLRCVGQLLIPPTQALAIQSRRVDVAER